MIDRILQFIDYKGINKSNFYKSTGLSNGFLDKVKDVGVSKLELILKSYPELSMEWLIFGTGNMLNFNFETENNSISESAENKGPKKDNKESWQTLFNKCTDKANELSDITEAILKVLNMSKAGNMIKLPKEEIDVLKNFEEIGRVKLLKLGFDGLLNKNYDYKEYNYENLLEEININISIANQLLLKYIDEVQFAVFCDNDKRPYLIYPDNFLQDE